jgi:hypothetical protein
VNLSEQATATATTAGPGNLLSLIRSVASGSVKVVYHYIPSNALQPGQYVIVQTSEPPGTLDGYETTNNITPIPGSNNGSDTIPVTLGPTDSLNNNFGEITPSSVAGGVYYDKLGLGHWQYGDVPLQGVTITLTGTNDLGQAISQTTQTIGDGTFSFGNLRPGTYTLTETQPAGYLQGTNNVGSFGGTINGDSMSFTVPPGIQGANYDFGELLPPSSVSGGVYYDKLGLGHWQYGDVPLQGVTITLTGTNDLGQAISQTTQTLGDGTYSFGNLRAGTYTLTETQPAGYLQGTNNVGSFGGTINGDSMSFTVPPGIQGANYNFGELLPAPQPPPPTNPPVGTPPSTTPPIIQAPQPPQSPPAAGAPPGGPISDVPSPSKIFLVGGDWSSWGW